MSAGQRCVSDTLDPNASQTSVGPPTDVLLSGLVKCAIVHSRWFQTKHRESTHTYRDKLPSKVVWRCLLPPPVWLQTAAAVQRHAGRCVVAGQSDCQLRDGRNFSMDGTSGLDHTTFPAMGS